MELCHAFSQGFKKVLPERLVWIVNNISQILYWVLGWKSENGENMHAVEAQEPWLRSQLCWGPRSKLRRALRRRVPSPSPSASTDSASAGNWSPRMGAKAQERTKKSEQATQVLMCCKIEMDKWLKLMHLVGSLTENHHSPLVPEPVVQTHEEVPEIGCVSGVYDVVEDCLTIGGDQTHHGETFLSR